MAGLRWTPPALLAALALGAISGRAQTAALDLQQFATDSGNYNLVTTGNTTLGGATGSGATIGGGIAVGGTLAVSGSKGWTIASTAATGGSVPSLYLGGSGTSLTIASGSPVTLSHGFAATPNLTSGNYTWNSGTHKLTPTAGGSGALTTSGNGSTSPLSEAGYAMPSTSATLTTLSSTLDGLAATSGATVAVSGGVLDFTQSAVTSGVAVFDLNAALLTGGNTYNGSSFTSISINVPSGVDYLINVLGLANNATLFASGVTFNAVTNDNQLLWNIYETSTVTETIASSGFYGSILAPDVSLTDTSVITGQVAAANFTDSGGANMNDLTFVVVPEPRTYALAAVALCGAAAVLGRRRLRTGLAT